MRSVPPAECSWQAQTVSYADRQPSGARGVGVSKMTVQLAGGQRCARCDEEAGSAWTPPAVWKKRPAAGSADLLPAGVRKTGAAAMLVLLSTRSVQDAHAVGQGLLLLRGSAARAMGAQL